MLLAGGLRVYLSTCPLVETTDLIRNAAYSEAFWRHGFRVYDMLPGELNNQHFNTNEWTYHTFDYPVFALLFFTGLLGVSQSLTAFKLVLSACDLIAALLVAKITRNSWLMLAAFAAPTSLWWTSLEGQTEAWMSVWTLLALAALFRERFTRAWAWLGVAAQIKGVPVLLLPLFAALSGKRIKGYLIFALTFSASALALAYGSYVSRMFGPDYKPTGFNPVHWSPFWITQWMSKELIIADAIYSYTLFVVAVGGLGWALYRGLRGEAWFIRALSHLPVILLIAYCKTGEWSQFWYFVMVPAFACAIVEPQVRAALIVLSALEPRACSQLWTLLTS